MVLANVGHLLSTHQTYGSQKVLLIDWDLEAPGLERFFGTDRESIKPVGPGLIDYLTDMADHYRRQAAGVRLPESMARDPRAIEVFQAGARDYPFERYVNAVDGRPSLWLMHAGRRSPGGPANQDEYWEKVRTFNWDLFYGDNGSFFTHFRETLMAEFNYVLIDSRTGLTDIGGICTRVMPEKLVLVFAPNHQNIDGVVSVAAKSVGYRMASRDPRSLTVFPVASRIDASASALRTVWWRGGKVRGQEIRGYQSIFEQLFRELYRLDQCELGNYFDETQVPHDSDYAYGEAIAAAIDGVDDRLGIGYACDQLARRLVQLTAPWEEPVERPGRSQVALAQLPSPIAWFTGRESELALMIKLLDPAAAAPAAVVITGLAGVGKTSLAIQAGNVAVERGWFPGGALFIDLHGYDEAPVDPTQALDVLLRALGVAAEQIPAGFEERTGLYRSMLAGVGEPMLIIADNASSEAQVRPLLPGAGAHRVLVTSRHTLAGLRARLLDLAVLDTVASVKLLDATLRAARPDDDRISGDSGAASQLALICGGLPLALQITAALLTIVPERTAAELVADLTTERDRLETLSYDDGSAGSTASVAAAFELSYRRLDETSARVFRTLPVSSGPDLSTATAAVLADLPVGTARKILGGLAQAHLVEPAPGATGRWQMHDLLRLYAQQVFDASADPDEREQARDRLLDYFLRSADAADQSLRARPGEFTSRADALAWFDAERLGLIAAVGLAADTGRGQIALRLCTVLAEYLTWRRRFDDLLTIGRISLDAAGQLGDRAGQGTALTVLGTALEGLRRFDEAITAQTDAVGICREIGDRHREAQALTSLGTAFRGLRRFDEAITAHQQAAAIFRDTSDQQGEGQALGNLGNALQALGRSAEAVAAYQDAVAILRETGDRYGEGVTLGNLGSALQELGQFDQAVAAYQDAVAILRETGDRYGEGVTLGNLARAHQELGRFDQAVAAYQEAVAILRETGDRHSEGQTLVNLANALQGLGRSDQAVSPYEQAAAIFRETGDHRGEGQALVNLGVTLQGLGQFADAVATYQEAAAILRETGDRQSEGQALNNLGVTLQERGRSDQAITAYEEAVAIFRETGDHHGGGQALVNLGNALQELGRSGEAITAFKDAAATSGETADGPPGARPGNELSSDKRDWM